LPRRPFAVFGGWSPRYLDTEMPTAPVGTIDAGRVWPVTVVQDLKARFFLEAAKQTGVSAANDYIDGELHRFYRKQLFTNYAAIPNTVPLAEMPDYVAEAPDDITPGLAAQLASPPYPGFQDSLKLDAPLSVQALSRPGFFPFNKFSSVPVAISAARAAFAESGTNDALKRLMIVPYCHVKRLRTRTYTLATGATVQEVDGMDTGSGFIDLSGTVAGNPNRRPLVVLAAGAIESARLALLSAGNIPNAGEMGANLMVHLRKNVIFTATLPTALGLKQQELCVLLVRCRATLGNGTPVHFHLQITASAVPAGSGAGKSDALLFQNVPDLDNVRIFSETAPGEVDVSIRAVGEMLPNPQNNAVTVPVQPADNDEYIVPRALVRLVRKPERRAGDDAHGRSYQWGGPAGLRQSGDGGERAARRAWHDVSRIWNAAYGRRPDTFGRQRGRTVSLRDKSLCGRCVRAAHMRLGQSRDEWHRIATTARETGRA
jgi:hypothetical protein